MKKFKRKVEALPQKKVPFGVYIKRYWQLYVLLLLPLVYLFIFKYLPMVYIQIAFKDYKLGMNVWEMPITDNNGFKYFIKAFKNRDFIYALRNTVGLNLLDLIVGFPAPIILALMINEVRGRAFKRISQTLSYIPNFISWVVCAGLLGALLGGTGPVNDILIAIGLRDEPIYFFNEPSIFTPLAVGAGIWKGVGFGSILYLAALTAISPELYESAQLDGASKLQQLWHISIPGIMPTIALQLVLSLASILNVSFDKIYNMQNTMNLAASDTIDTYIYRIAMHGAIKDYSRGLALGLVRGVVCFVLFIIANRTSKKIGIGSAV